MLSSNDEKKNSQAEFKFFKDTPLETTAQTLLDLIANGRQEEAEILLQKKGYFCLTHKTTVRDPADRNFEALTGFQYALWAGDFHMWTMLLKYLPHEDAASQLKELEEKGVAYEYPGTNDWIKVAGEKHFDLSRLIKALENYVNNYKESEHWTDTYSKWTVAVGGAQKMLPACIAQEYCRNKVDWDLTYERIKKRSLVRALMVNNPVMDKNQYWYDGDGVGKYYAVLRGAAGQGGANIGFGGAGGDLEEMRILQKIRSEQYEELKNELLLGKGLKNSR